MPSQSVTVTFETPPAIAELIEALEDLRSQVGPSAVPRVRGVIEFNIAGPRIAALTVERPQGA